MPYTAIKAVYDRKAKQYDCVTQEVQPGDIGAAVNSGYYVTDNLAATLGRLVAGKLEWFNGLKPAAKDAVKYWLMLNVK